MSESDKIQNAISTLTNFKNQVDTSCKKMGLMEDWSERLSLANDLGNQLTKIIENHGDILFDKTKSNLKDMLDFSDYYNRHSDTACSDLISKIKYAVEELNMSITVEKKTEKRKSRRVKKIGKIGIYALAGIGGVALVGVVIFILIVNHMKSVTQP